MTHTEAQVAPANIRATKGEIPSEKPNVGSTSELITMLTIVLAAFKESNKELQKNNKALQNKVETGNRELREINDRFRKDKENNLQIFQENMKADIKLETEKFDPEV
jgi:predicted RNase H-like nuclease (RuvC/YqgF family)